MQFFSLRRSRYDELGLRRALADRMVPFLVAAMAFLAALAIAGWMGAAVLTQHWESGAGATLTVQVPNAGQPAATGSTTRLAAVQNLLATAPGVDSAQTLTDDQVNTLLRPWLGADLKNLAIPVPAVIAVHMSAQKDLSGLAAQLAKAAPGTILEDQAAWAGKLTSLARSLQLCAGLVLVIVTLVTAAVISVATHSGLAARREAILIVYQLGATDGYIARRFATRAAALAYVGGLIGALCALPVTYALATLAAPFDGTPNPDPSPTSMMPPLLWTLWLVLPGATAIIGYLTTQITMRLWLRRLP